jgi:hypothetical protein
LPKKGLLFSTAANYYINSSPGLYSVFYGPTLSIGHKILGQVTSNWAVTINKNTINGAAGPGVTTGRWNLSYVPGTGKPSSGNGHSSGGKGFPLWRGRHSIMSSLGYTHHDGTATVGAYDEWLWNLTYGYSF